MVGTTSVEEDRAEEEGKDDGAPAFAHPGAAEDVWLRLEVQDTCDELYW